MNNPLISRIYQSQATTRKPKDAKNSIMGKPGWRPGLNMATLKSRSK